MSACGKEEGGRVGGKRNEEQGGIRKKEGGRRSLRSVSVTVTDTDRDPYRSASASVRYWYKN